MKDRPALVPGVALTALVLGLTSGCYHYEASEIARVGPAHDVRVRVTQEQARELDSVLFREARLIQGRIVENGDPILLQVPVVSRLDAGRGPALHQRIRLAHADILEVELRTLDRTRTGLLVVGALGATVALVVHALTSRAGGDTRPPTIPPAEDLVPLFPRPWGNPR